MNGLNNVQKIDEFEINSDNYQSDQCGCGNQSEEDEVNILVKLQRRQKATNDLQEMKIGSITEIFDYNCMDSDH